MLTYVLIGAGDRGRVYSNRLFAKGYAKCVAVVDPDEGRLSDAGSSLKVEGAFLFGSDEQLFAKGKIADFAIISTLDRDHYEEAMKAMDLGYDLLLEKPIAISPEQCLLIQAKAEEKKCQVVVCHVLRYGPFFSALKKIVDGGELGKIVDIQHNENIGNFHFAHSYVRGNWGKEEETSPIILAKSCHDLDMLLYLTGKKCLSVASYGSLTYFSEAHAPKGSAARCSACPFKGKCRFSAFNVYLPMVGAWPSTVLTLDQTEAGVKKAIEEGPYGRCVYRCENDVVDHQVASLLFEDGVTATFNLSAFTDEVSRTIKIMCEDGEILGNEIANTIEIRHFSSNPNEARSRTIIHPAIESGGHNGSDHYFIEDFVKVFAHKEKAITDIKTSVMSHLMAFAIEESRLGGKEVSLADFTKNHQ